MMYFILFFEITTQSCYEMPQIKTDLKQTNKNKNGVWMKHRNQEDI